MKFLSKRGDKRLDMLNPLLLISCFWPAQPGLPEEAGVVVPLTPEAETAPFTSTTPGSNFCVSSASERDWNLAAREILVGRCDMRHNEVEDLTPEVMENVIDLIQEAHEAHAQSYNPIDMSRPDLANLDQWGVYFDYFGLGTFYRDNIAFEPCYGSLIFVPEPATLICEAARPNPAAPAEPVAQPVPAPVTPPPAPPVPTPEPVDAGPTIPSLRAQLRSEIRDIETLIDGLNFAGGTFANRAQRLEAMIVQARNYLHSDDIDALQQQVGGLRSARRRAQTELDNAANRRNDR